MTGVAEAVEALEKAIENGDVVPKSVGFAKSLVRQAKKKGVDKMSHKQIHWIEKLGQTVEPRAEPRADALRAVVDSLSEKDQSFGKSLLGQWDGGKNLSDKQWKWVVKLADKASGTKAGSKAMATAPTPVAPPTSITGYDGVDEFFKRPGSRLKQAKVHLLCEDNIAPMDIITKHETYDRRGNRPGAFTGYVTTPTWREVVIRTKRRRNEDAGTLYVEGLTLVNTDVERTVVARKGWMTKQLADMGQEDFDRKYGNYNFRHIHFPFHTRSDAVKAPKAQTSNYHFYGTIDRATGTFYPTKSAEADNMVMSVMEQFRIDPGETAVRLGKKGGRCSFCNAGLSDHRSIAHGYGPTCAKNYALPWTTKDAIAIELNITQMASLRLLQLRPGVWACIDIDTNEVMWTVDGTMDDARATISENHGEGVVYIPEDEEGNWVYQ
jgi:hypothetical protein